MTERMYYKASEIARYLGVSKSQVEGWRKSGRGPIYSQLPSANGITPVYLYRLDDVDTWMESYVKTPLYPHSDYVSENREPRPLTDAEFERIKHLGKPNRGLAFTEEDFRNAIDTMLYMVRFNVGAKGIPITLGNPIYNKRRIVQLAQTGRLELILQILIDEFPDFPYSIANRFVLLCNNARGSKVNDLVLWQDTTGKLKKKPQKFNMRPSGGVKRRSAK